MANLTISLQQRNALCEFFRERLTGIGDIEIALNSGDYASAERLSGEFSDLLRFAVDDLGFGGRSGNGVALTSPHDVLLRVLHLFQERAEEADHAETPAREDAQRQHQRNLLVAETCQEPLSELERCQ